MRIRKNRKVLPLMFPGERIQPYDCQINRSPLDSISNSRNPDSEFESCLLQFGRNSRFEREDNANVVVLEREAPEAVGKKVDGGDATEIIIIEDSDEDRTEKKDEGNESKGKAVRPRSQRSAAKNPRWLNSKSKDFYYYDCD